MDFYGKNFDVMAKLLDMTSIKNKVIANNIANVNTPGYRKLDFFFHDELAKAVKSNEIGNIRNVEGNLMLSEDKSTRKDGNNVDIDKELIEFYKSIDRHKFGIEIVSRKFKGLITAIRGR